MTDYLRDVLSKWEQVLTGTWNAYEGNGPDALQAEASTLHNVQQLLDTVRCDRCVHWQEDTTYPQWSQCRLAQQTDVPDEDVPMASWDYEGYSSGLYTRPDFHCAAFKPKGDE